ncbi:hypothetical protein A3762_02140 [Oleiphilus sp. HI0125]|uniref:O-antigen ligase family protein n=1 Tax=Oleiphilus sp. HI0125 TaxID=1822266 RepID=UPI0007C28E8F|nr:hypothetical protein [Oleiphilus sp. HI0125]KZZ61693.1 hypothetical protein A3762_02140 [Oleiphilus sp. HI0125]
MYRILVNESRILQRYFIVVLSLFFIFALVPYLPTLGWSRFNFQKILQILLLSFCFGAVLICQFRAYLYHANNCSLTTFTPIQLSIYALLIFFGFGLMSVIYSHDPSYVFMHWFHWILLACLYIVSTALTSQRYLLALGCVFVCTFTILCLFSLLNIVFSVLSSDPLDPGRIYRGFPNIRFFNQVQAFIIPLLLGGLLFEQTKRIAWLLLTLNLLLMVIGYGRGIFVSYIALLVLLPVFFKRYFKLSLWGSAALALALVIYALLKALAPAGIMTPDALLRESQFGRIDGWLQVIHKFEVHTLFYGVGPGMYREAWGGGHSLISHPHNSLIQLIYEWGAVAAGIVLSAVICTLYFAVRAINATDQTDKLLITLLMMFVMALSYSMFSGVVVMPIPQTLMFIVWGMLIGRISLVNESSDFHEMAQIFDIRPFVRSLVAVITVVLLGLFYFYLSFAAELFLAQDPSGIQGIGPRFWQIGLRFSDLD